MASSCQIFSGFQIRSLGPGCGGASGSGCENTWLDRFAGGRAQNDSGLDAQAQRGMERAGFNDFLLQPRPNAKSDRCLTSGAEAFNR
jgi:hypothetical protein